MGDGFLIASIVVILVILVVASIYVLVGWQHPDDKNEAYIPKVLVVVGLVLSAATVLLLPIDVANNAGDVACDGNWDDDVFCGGINMFLYWEVQLTLVILLIWFFLPYALFYYETDDGVLLGKSKESRLFKATGYQCMVLAFTLIILLPLYFSIGTSRIPVQKYTVSVADMDLYNVTDVTSASKVTDLVPQQLTNDEVKNANSDGDSGTVVMDLEFQMYMIALVAFFGSFLFVFFAGVGLSAVPINLIAQYVYRPQHMDAVAYAENQINIQKRTQELVDIIRLLKREREDFFKADPGRWDKRRRNRADRATVNKITQMVYVLENDHDDLKACRQTMDDLNPLIPYVKLALGLFSALLSLLWFLHICVFMLPDPPASEFLNDYFRWFDTWFPLFGTVSVALFGIYLLICTVVGCFKLGLRFFCITIHPMKINGTYMNSFLFNVGIILLVSVPVTAFCTLAFSTYARFTDIAVIFLVLVRHMDAFAVFFRGQVFTIMLLVITGVSAIYFLVKPRDTPVSATELKSSMQRQAVDRRL